ncbi:MAG TPA: hypothetical protein VLG13_01145 [Patescibacteria group bacterium]|nr:hypothetical protein [Patescibacteria group bacterium]
MAPEEKRPSYFDTARSMSNDPELLRALSEAEAGIPPNPSFIQRVGNFFRKHNVVGRIERLVAPENFRDYDVDEHYGHNQTKD